MTWVSGHVALVCDVELSDRFPYYDCTSKAAPKLTLPLLPIGISVSLLS